MREPPPIIPTPGSPEAKQQGCLCPVMDNNRGRGRDMRGGSFVRVEGCPLHWPVDPNELDICLEDDAEEQEHEEGLWDEDLDE